MSDTDTIEHAGIVLFNEWEKLPADLRCDVRDRLAHVLYWGRRIADLTRERDEWQQAAQVEAGLVDEFKARAEAAEKERDEARDLAAGLTVQTAQEQACRRAAEKERDELAVRIDGAEVERDEWRLRGQASGERAEAAEKERDALNEALGRQQGLDLFTLSERAEDAEFRLARAREALAWIEDNEPATQECSLAHDMAQTAREALAGIGPAGHADREK
jgi:hypothetical protein